MKRGTLDKNIAIQFEGVGKQYRLGRVGTGTLQHDLNRWFQTSILGKEDPYLKVGEVNDRAKKGKSDYVWALKGVTFQVEQGDVTGIIGKNGAGKSTLLKLLSRITAPTTGDIRYRGRIASLLEVGTGFHQELTARENIYMNGSIMGMTRQEITRKLDEIVDFSGVERYLDTPVKRFSSGMIVRLGFAVAAFLEPEILVVDEVLAVGDAEFQKKAIGKMKDVSSSGGRTVLFVSHNMTAVRNLCRNGIVLKNGMIDFTGTADECIDHYQSGIAPDAENKIVDGVRPLKPFLSIRKITVNGSEKANLTIPSSQAYLDLVIEGTTTEKFIGNIAVRLCNLSDVPLAVLNEGLMKGELFPFEPGEFTFKRRIRLPEFVSTGDCFMDLNLIQSKVQGYFNGFHCATLHFEGSCLEFCTPNLLNRDGFFCLKSEAL